jgi:hypothetical protein
LQQGASGGGGIAKGSKKDSPMTPLWKPSTEHIAGGHALTRERNHFFKGKTLISNASPTQSQ